MARSDLIDKVDALCAEARKKKAAIQAAGLRPALKNTGYSSAEPMEEERSEAADRGQPPAEQRG